MLEPEKKWIVSFNGHNSVPVAWDYEDGPIEMDRLLFLLTTSVVKGTPKWGQRSHSAIFDFQQNGIVYMMPSLPSAEELSTDWRVQLMTRITEITQEEDINFVPVVALYDRQSAYVPNLAEML